ncbi:MAG TPA: hypothetical protein VFJ95_12230 [Gammaproteobacteria bacterium]|jgi:hypothetical protein|nr:hypothetical protein [Gammaproteobacteria bacterium]
MGIEKQNESDKIHGDKFESTVDRVAADAAGRKPGQEDSEDEGDELQLDDDESADIEDTEDE